MAARRAAEAPPAQSAAPFVPATDNLRELTEASKGCRGCDLYHNATQTVFGEGEPRARLMLVGEQPGDQEDLSGHPFVGPAGQLLDQALADAGVDRGQAYVTNAVKHFKWLPRGKRRIHNKPNSGEIRACRPWLEAEIAVVQPEVIVLLGATAAQTLLGPQFRVTRDRGRLLSDERAGALLATIHPSALLRIEEADERHAAYDAFVADLRVAAQALQGSASAAEARG